MGPDSNAISRYYNSKKILENGADLKSYRIGQQIYAHTHAHAIRLEWSNVFKCCVLTLLLKSTHQQKKRKYMPQNHKYKCQQTH